MKLTPQWVLAITLASVASISSAQDKKPKTTPSRSEAPASAAPKMLSSQEIFSKGFQALQSNDPATAADLFRAGLEIEPSDGNAWLYLFKAQMLLGDASGAESSKTRALSLGIPGTAFESTKPAKISLPPLPAVSFNVIGLPDAVRQKLEEDPAYRLPIPPGNLDSDAWPNFITTNINDSKVIYSLGGLITVATSAHMYEVLTEITINGELFSNKSGSQFGIKTKTIRILPPDESYPSGIYSRHDETTLCEIMHPVSEAKARAMFGDKIPNDASNGMTYKCSSIRGRTRITRTLEAANASVIANHTPMDAEYIAYFPKKRILLRNIKEKDINSLQ
ncbi:MAG: hypothetical protein J0H59_20440 [Comamonadaceae bacterium]|nr:hypothetical protein [Comamonadaceae bacterium]